MRFNLLDLPAGVVPAGRVQPQEAVARQTQQDDLDKKAARFERNSVGLPLPFKSLVVLGPMQRFWALCVNWNSVSKSKLIILEHRLTRSFFNRSDRIYRSFPYSELRGFQL